MTLISLFLCLSGDEAFEELLLHTRLFTAAARRQQFWKMELKTQLSSRGWLSVLDSLSLWDWMCVWLVICGE